MRQLEKRDGDGYPHGHPDGPDCDQWWNRSNQNCTTSITSPFPTTSISVTDGSPTLTPTVAVYNQSDHNYLDRNSSSAPIIAGVSSGLLLLLASMIIIWYLVRRRKRQQMFSQFKTVLMSPHDTPQLLQRECQDQGLPSYLEYDKAEKGNCSSYPIEEVTQLPTFPSPTRQAQTSEDNQRPFSSRSNYPALPQYTYTNSVGQQDNRDRNFIIPSQRTSSGFYVDILNLVGDTPVTNSGKHRSVASIPASNPNSRPTSFVAQKQNVGEMGGATPRASKESRRYPFNYPPPPPPPSVPPPAIPTEMVGESSKGHSVRSRALTNPGLLPLPGVSFLQGSGSHRQRSQSNAQLTDEFTTALERLYPALPLPPSLR
ncbi:hypothetical protein BGZ46_007449 [Entomortierella lignicola]|nr:hypothetical protein BGZ46_007449 [Entomortierella lignicola]